MRHCALRHHLCCSNQLSCKWMLTMNLADLFLKCWYFVCVHGQRVRWMIKHLYLFETAQRSKTINKSIVHVSSPSKSTTDLRLHLLLSVQLMLWWYFKISIKNDVCKRKLVWVEWHHTDILLDLNYFIATHLFHRFSPLIYQAKFDQLVSPYYSKPSNNFLWRYCHIVSFFLHQ